MKFLVLQHLCLEDPGTLRLLWEEEGVTWDTVELDLGDSIPGNLAQYDALIVMGGPMDIWDEHRFPWLKQEKEAICEWVLTLCRPFLGICLGHQLLAEAVGGSVAPMETPEVGILEVARHSAAANDTIISTLPLQFDCLQWHESEVKTLPADAEIIASSELCPVQAFRWGYHAYGLQFHIEVTGTSVLNWGEVPAYKASLSRSLGPGACSRLNGDVVSMQGKLEGLARKLNVEFLKLVQDFDQVVR